MTSLAFSVLKELQSVSDVHSAALETISLNGV
jgi:hypothetical protein